MVRWAILSHQWLQLEEAQIGLLSFAGHGSQVRDMSGDEIDGKSETICPCDFKLVSLPPHKAVRSQGHTFALLGIRLPTTEKLIRYMV